MKRKRQHVGGDVSPPVGPVDALHPPVVHTDDPQVELPDPQDAPERLQPAAERRPSERDGSLQVAERQAHGGRSPEPDRCGARAGPGCAGRTGSRSATFPARGAQGSVHPDSRGRALRVPPGAERPEGVRRRAGR